MMPARITKSTHEVSQQFRKRYETNDVNKNHKCKNLEASTRSSTTFSQKSEINDVSKSQEDHNVLSKAKQIQNKL